MPVTARAALHAMSSNMNNIIQMYMFARQYKFQDEENERARELHDQLMDLREKEDKRQVDLHPYRQSELAESINRNITEAGEAQKRGDYYGALTQGAIDENKAKGDAFDRQVKYNVEKDKLGALIGQLKNPAKADPAKYEETVGQVRSLISQLRVMKEDFSEFDTRPVSDMAMLEIMNFGLSVPLEGRGELISTVDENPNASLSELVSAILRNPNISVELKDSATAVQNIYGKLGAYWVDRLNKAYKDAGVNELPEGARGVMINGEYHQPGPDDEEMAILISDWQRRRDSIALLEFSREGISPDYHDPMWQSIGIINMSPLFQEQWFDNSPEEIARRKEEEANRLSSEVFGEFPNIMDLFPTRKGMTQPKEKGQIGGISPYGVY